MARLTTDPRPTRLQRLARVLAALYPLSLVTVALAFHLVGERWWLTGAVLYLPRVGFALPVPVVVAALVVARPGRAFTAAITASSLVAFLFVMGFVIPWPSGADANAKTLRLLTYNINSAHGGADAIVAEVDRFTPDVVFMQEIGMSDTANAVATLLRARYPTVDVTGQFILATKSTLVSVTQPEKVSYYGHPRTARWMHYVLDTPLGRIALYNVHPLSPREGLYSLRAHGGLTKALLTGRFFTVDPSLLQWNAGLRALEIGAIADAAAAETDPVIVAGDTNLPGLSATFGRTLSRFQDGFAKAGWGFGYTFPTDAQRALEPKSPWMRIDRIMASDALRFTRFQVGSSLASDHVCAVADLQRRP